MKDVLYLESDEEITSAIDKMLKSPGRTVQLVLPKRATLLQSIVNQRLLKKAATDAGKQLVLVTTDKTATHLAGKVGLAVAATLKSAPQVPTVEPPAGFDEETAEINELDQDEAELQKPGANTSAAVTSSMAAAARSAANKPDYAKPVMVKRPVPEADGSDEGDRHVPDFGGLQKKALWGGGLLALVVLAFLANFFLKTANVTLYAKGTAVKADFDFAVDPALRESDPDKSVLAGQSIQQSRELSASFTATGKKDVGTKAKGQMMVKNETGASQTLVAGTRFVSAGKTFTADAEVVVPGGKLGELGEIVPGQVTVGVTAEAVGDSYNLAPARYNIPALPAEKQAKIYGQGNQMSGGTTKEITVVTQADVDQAKTALLDKDKEQGYKDVEAKTASNYRLLDGSFSQAVAEVKAEPVVGAEATTAQLTLRVEYTALAVNNGDLKTLVRHKEQAAIGSGNQIYDDGIEQATITASPRETSGRQSFHFSSEAYAGAKIDTGQVAKDLAGQKFGDAVDTASKLAGVERAEVSIRPGWSSRLPRLAKNIKIEIKVANRSSE